MSWSASSQSDADTAIYQVIDTDIRKKLYKMETLMKVCQFQEYDTSLSNI